MSGGLRRGRRRPAAPGESAGATHVAGNAVVADTVANPCGVPGEAAGDGDLRPTSPVDPLPRALGLLARREHSRRELARKLGQAGIEPGALSQALDRLDAEGLQSDQRFAELLVRSRIAQGYGPRRIRAELGQHGLDAAAAGQAIDAAAPDWRALLEALYRRRFRDACGSPRERDRRQRHLLQRGFDLADIRAVTRMDGDDPGFD